MTDTQQYRSLTAALQGLEAYLHANKLDPWRFIESQRDRPWVTPQASWALLTGLLSLYSVAVTVRAYLFNPNQPLTKFGALVRGIRASPLFAFSGVCFNQLQVLGLKQGLPVQASATLA